MPVHHQFGPLACQIESCDTDQKDAAPKDDGLDIIKANVAVQHLVYGQSEINQCGGNEQQAAAGAHMQPGEVQTAGMLGRNASDGHHGK